MSYKAPVDEMRFILEDLCGLDRIAALPALSEHDPETCAAVLHEAARFATETLAPLNAAGDHDGVGFGAGEVSTPRGWAAAYRAMVEGGWTCPSAAPEHGGMGLPAAVNACVQEMFQGANAAFQLCPMLTQGAVEAIDRFASPALKDLYLPRLVSGEWTGAMDLTEPQAGSDLSAIRARAEPDRDGHLIFGQKIFITYGEHDMAGNIVHLVLARLPGAPAGVKGISLFLVPKFLPGPDGEPGRRNDVRCVSVEKKLGIHASPTCTMAFGDDGGAKGWLVGEPHQGLACMFAMMNDARLNVGLQGIGIAHHAAEQAAAYAAERRQGAAEGHDGPAPLTAHADIRRMLGLMRAGTRAARVTALRAAAAADFARHAEDPEARAAARARLDLLIPVVKGWSTEMAVEAASLGLQVHGGMGYVEETGAAQHLRDARITTIYEGTTGIQALDFVGRKILRDRGAALSALIAEIEAEAAAMTDPAFAAICAEAAALLTALREALLSGPAAAAPLAAAAPALELAGIALGAWGLAAGAEAAARRREAGESGAMLDSWAPLARFHGSHMLPRGRAALAAVLASAETCDALSPADLGAGG